MIYVCGEALIDMLPGITATGEDSFIPHTGGSPFNTCIAIARLGTYAGFLGRISTDFFGKMLFDELDRNDVDLTVTQRGDEPTTLGFVKTKPGKDPEYAFYTSGTADCSLRNEEIPDVFSDKIEALAFGSISLLMEPGATVIENLVKREKGKRVLSFDPNIRPVLIKDDKAFHSRCERLCSLSTIVKISDVDLKWLYPDIELDEAAEKVKEFGPVIVVVTKGAEGSFVLKDDLKVESSGTEVQVVDTVGAGDTFHAGFLSWLVRNDLLNLQSLKTLTKIQLKEALDFAGQCAEVTISRPGADPPYAYELGM